jgi:hypothetical protein
MAFDFVKHLQELDAPVTAKVAEDAPQAKKAAKAESASKPSEKQAVDKTASFVEVVDARMQKIAKIIEDERDEEHAQLFKNCVSACFHYKMAGYTIDVRKEVTEDGETVKVAYDRAEDPNEFVAMSYNMYKDILKSRS